jgi:hypothetical protein
MKYTGINTLLAVGLAVAAGPASAMCLTFGSSTDLFELQLARTQASGFYPIAALETTFNRATHGTVVISDGKYRLSLTKNTNTATVAYQCDISSTTMNGQCNILVFTADPANSSRMTDLGTLMFGSCITPALDASATLGE